MASDAEVSSELARTEKALCKILQSYTYATMCPVLSADVRIETFLTRWARTPGNQGTSIPEELLES